MNVRKWLMDADPLAHEQAPAAEDVERMRQRVIAALDERRPATTFGVRIAWAGAIGAVALVVAGALSWRSEPEPARAPAGIVAAPHQIPATAVSDRVEPGQTGIRRQLHFATPGGTRIIWVFNSDFKL